MSRALAPAEVMQSQTAGAAVASNCAQTAQSSIVETDVDRLGQ
jgi:hypothetical protein